MSTNRTPIPAGLDSCRCRAISQKNLTPGTTERLLVGFGLRRDGIALAFDFKLQIVRSDSGVGPPTA